MLFSLELSSKIVAYEDLEGNSSFIHLSTAISKGALDGLCDVLHQEMSIRFRAIKGGAMRQPGGQ